MPDRIPPLAALRAFAAVARHGSFASAAATLNVSTSAVSHQIRGLEDTLGAALLTRARNGAGRTTVTPSGAILQREVELAFAQLGAACETVRTHARGGRPMLAISANGSVASLWLAPRLAAFAALHPSVQWHVRSIEENEPDMVREGLDLALLRVRRGALADGDRLLFSETVFPVCSPSLPFTGRPEDLPRHTLLQEDHVSSPEKDWTTWLKLLGCGRECEGDGRAVPYLQCRARRGGRGRRHRARTRAADRSRPGKRAPDAAVRRCVDARLVGLHHPPATRRGA